MEEARNMRTKLILEDTSLHPKMIVHDRIICKLSLNRKVWAIYDNRKQRIHKTRKTINFAPFRRCPKGSKQLIDGIVEGS